MAMKPAMEATSSANQIDPAQVTARTIGMRTTAEATRTLKSRHFGGSAVKGEASCI